MKAKTAIILTLLIICLVFNIGSAIAVDPTRVSGDYFAWILNILFFIEMLIVYTLLLISTVVVINHEDTKVIPPRAFVLLMTGGSLDLIFWGLTEFRHMSEESSHSHPLFFLVYGPSLLFILIALLMKTHRSNE